MRNLPAFPRLRQPVTRCTGQKWRQALTCLATTAALLAASVSAAAWAAAPDDVKQRFQERFPGVPVTAVAETPYGLYEVQIDDTLVYTDADVSWVLEGTLIDARTRQNVTASRMEQLNAVPFDQLPLELAFVQVKGDGSRRIAVFEDPNCPYCKEFRRTLQDVDNITIYTFLYPILSPDSREKSRAVWCAPDKAAAWDGWMLRNERPFSATCDAPLDALLQAGRRLRVTGTPTIFFADGTRMSGALPRPVLEQRLAQATP